jgi:hypothetical protein
MQTALWLLWLALPFLCWYTLRRRFTGRHLKPLTTNPERFDFQQRTKYSIQRAIGCVRADGPSFEIRRRHWYHRLFGALSAGANNVSLPDPALDRAFLIMADDPAALQKALGRETVLAALKELLTLPVGAVRAEGTRFWCVIAGKDKDKKSPIESFARPYQLLEQLARETSLPSAHDAMTVADNTPKSRAVLAVEVLHATLLTQSIVLFLIALFDHRQASMHDLIPAELGGALLLAALGLGFVLIVFSRSSWMPRVIGHYFMVGLIGFAGAGFGWVREGNLYLPQGAPIVYRLPVIERQCTLRCKERKSTRDAASFSGAAAETECTPQSRSILLDNQKHSPYCYQNVHWTFRIVLPSWKEKTRRLNVSTDDTLFDSVQPGTMIAMPVEPGAFGITWYDDQALRVAD